MPWFHWWRLKHNTLFFEHNPANPSVGLIYLAFFFLYHYKQTFFSSIRLLYLGWRINKLKPSSKEINDNPNINKQARGLQRSFLLSTVRSPQNEYNRMQDTFSPLMVFSKLFLVQEHLFKEKVTILCINANFTRNFALVWWPHWKPLLSRNLQENVSLKLA